MNINIYTKKEFKVYLIIIKKKEKFKRLLTFVQKVISIINILKLKQFAYS
jgi:hypothetical protein